MSDDEFDIFDANPVTSDDEDTIESRVEQNDTAATEVNGETVRVDGQRGADVETPTANYRTDASRFDAQCRWCRHNFDADRGPLTHECREQPVAACRYCGETFQRQDDPELHVYSCEEAQRHHERERRQARAEAYRGDGVENSLEYVDPWYHEFKAYLKWDVTDRQRVGRDEFSKAMRTYWGLNSLQKEHDFEDHGRMRTGIEHGGDEYAVAFAFKNSSIAVPDRDEYRLEDVREYLIYVYPDEYTEYTAAKEDGRARAVFTVKPRWPGIDSKGDLPPISNPHDITGFDVETSGTNLPFDAYPKLLHRALEALRDRQGFRFDSYTEIHPDDLHPDRVHRSSNITDAELYVRVDREETGRVYAFDGTLHRIAMLLGDERGGFAKAIRDDRECEGHYHVASIGTMRASELLGGHELGKEFKHYHLRDPESVDGALQHPKIGVALQHSITEDTVYYQDLEDVERELDEALLNVLEWSDLPLQPTDEYIADDYFKATGSERFRKLASQALPRLESQQNRDVWSVVGNMNETDALLVDQLLTDGGQQRPEDIADAIDRHLDTVYKALDRLGPIVEHTYGDVQLASKHVAQEVLKRIEGVKDSVQQSLRESASDLVRSRLFGDGENKWSRWRNHYGVQIRENDDGTADLEVGFKPESIQRARQIVRSGAVAWHLVTGKPLRKFGLKFDPRVTTVDGDTWAPEFYADALGSAG